MPPPDRDDGPHSSGTSRAGPRRGLTKPDELDAHLDAEPRTLYVGFDPTADSLHMGSLVPLLALRRFQLAGHRPIVLVGGGTGLIGDPSGKAGERALNPPNRWPAGAERLKRRSAVPRLRRGPHAAILVDNSTWLSKLELIAFLRDIGKHFGLGAMVAQGVGPDAAWAGAASPTRSSATCCCRPTTSWSLHERHGCTLQMGGSDQWGNITAGAELIRRVRARRRTGSRCRWSTKADGGEDRQDRDRDRVARSGQRPRRTRCTSSG